MARGTSNTIASYIDGDVFPAAAEDAIVTIATSADDDNAYDDFDIQPPAGATITNVNMGHVWRKQGSAGVLGDLAARTAHIDPLRIIRSSTDSALPRNMLSGTTEAVTDLAMSTVVATAGKWKIDLIYAQLAYVDPSEPTKGTVVTIGVATQATEVVFAAAPSFAVLPANTASPPTWYEPLAYVKNYQGQTTLAQEDIVDVGLPVVAGFTVDRAARLSIARTGIAIHRGYCDANNNPSNLVTGGTSKWVAGGVEQIFTKTFSPVVLGRRAIEHVKIEIPIPLCERVGDGTSFGFAGNGVVCVPNDTLILDDTRDWRNANFRVEIWAQNSLVAQFAEDDTSGALNRCLPTMASAVAGGPNLYLSVGQSWFNTLPNAPFASTKRWIALLGNDADNAGTGKINAGGLGDIAVGDGIGLYVDSATGFIRMYSAITGIARGVPMWILIDAWFSNHKAL